MKLLDPDPDDRTVRPQFQSIASSWSVPADPIPDDHRHLGLIDRRLLYDTRQRETCVSRAVYHQVWKLAYAACFWAIAMPPYAPPSTSFIQTLGVRIITHMEDSTCLRFAFESLRKAHRSLLEPVMDLYLPTCDLRQFGILLTSPCCLVAEGYKQSLTILSGAHGLQAQPAIKTINATRFISTPIGQK